MQNETHMAQIGPTFLRGANTIKYSADGGANTIKYSTDGGISTIKYSDDGGCQVMADNIWGKDFI